MGFKKNMWGTRIEIVFPTSHMERKTITQALSALNSFPGPKNPLAPYPLNGWSFVCNITQTIVDGLRQ